jgi:hypothetical protein
MSNNVSAKTAGAADGTASVATIAARTNGKTYGVSVLWSYDTTPTGGKLTIKSGTTVIAEVDCPTAGPGFLPITGFDSAKGESLSATLAAGGGSVAAKVAIAGRYG